MSSAPFRQGSGDANLTKAVQEISESAWELGYCGLYPRCLWHSLPIHLRHLPWVESIVVGPTLPGGLRSYMKDHRSRRAGSW